MKKLAVLLGASLVLSFAACSDSSSRPENPSKKSGDEQLSEPVMNSGPETEAARATDAVQDSANYSGKKDSTATNYSNQR